MLYNNGVGFIQGICRRPKFCISDLHIRVYNEAMQLRSLLTAVVRVHVFIALWFPR
jgi:hypothetical protein